MHNPLPLDLYRELLDNSSDPFYSCTSDFRYLYANHAFADGIGKNLNEIVGRTVWEVFPKSQAVKRVAVIKWVFDYAKPKIFEAWVQRQDGDRYYLTTFKPILGDQGHVLWVLASAKDITERKLMEVVLREQKEFFHLIAENIGGFIAVLDREGRRVYSSPSYQKLFGDITNLYGTDSFAEIYPQDQERVKQIFRETVQTGKGRQIRYRLIAADGGIREIESLGNVIRDSEGKVTSVVVMSHDITERKQREDEVRQLAFNDLLTRLPNRRLLNDRLSQAMAANKRSGCYGALMFLDLDNFKPLNDRHGHDAGDLLLIQAANRLRSCVRETDTVARFGGDEFVVVVSELDADKAESIVQAEIVAEKIRATLSEPYQLTIKHAETGEAIVEYQCTASIGVTLFIKQEHSQDEILKWADEAMYQAKAAGRNSIRIYDLNS
ncbi:MAG: diguanylate cyclase [Betaproteobacteria bacterium]